ncbi:MarR family winged helix-turn-helix transcriptional regulator [Pseudonocardia dioxanivorans]|uniref:MarR family winged helix-turn-helix transcriptional regulator n=1 Tax=Pseudonocardia dioxanivorans TaxID=240495 RepID=UPI000D034257|nr:MarR family transcriptional regulator [Pseudonocardia dioxanivorans]
MADVRSIERRRRHRANHVPLTRLLGLVERHVGKLVEKALVGHGLTVDQWRVLDVLADGQGHAQSELAATIVVPGPTLTKIVDKLVDMALVYRIVDERDRRRVLAFLSEKGGRVHTDLAVKVEVAEAEAMTPLDDGDQEMLLDILTRLGRTDAPVTTPQS